MNVGVAFGDHISKGKVKKRYTDSGAPIQSRPVILLLLLLILPAFIFLKLINIQIIHGGYYKSLSDANRTKTIVIYPSRGVMFDRNGESLVVNRPNLQNISNGKTSGQIAESELRKTNSLRYYPLKEITSHILGYVGKISAEELTQAEFKEYTQDAVIGKGGLESYYDKILRGENGKELIEIDALGNKIRTLGTLEPVAGKDITLTINAGLQKVSYEALPADKKGAVIVTNLKGEILAMVSKPSYDANLFTMGETYIATNSAYQNISSLLSDNLSQPLLDRAISGQYPPGSTFKLVTAAAGLEEKVIDKSYTVEDTGVIKVGEFSFGNWFFLERGGKDGIVDVVKGISRSNDIFFYKLAEKITVDTLSRYAGELGVGKILGIDLPGEKNGLLPSKKWKSEHIKEPWYLGDTYHYGIGQGYLLTTPLQVNSWTATIANGGTLYRPHLLKAADANVLKSNLLSTGTVDLIRRGMVDSCKPGGVAWPLFGFRVKNPDLKIDNKNINAVKTSTNSAALKDYREISLACKTGTAQHGGEETLPHAWITLFAPAYQPEIVITVLVESAGQGSDVAAPVAKKILEEYFAK